MRFPWSFTRNVGPGAKKPLLSAEEAPPPGVLDETAAAASLSADNVLVSRQVNTLGWPVQRVVAAWIGPRDANVVPPIDLAAFIFDHRLGCWLLMSEVRGSEARRACVFDIPCLHDAPTVGRKGGQIAAPQALELMLVPRPVKAIEAYPPGVYTFALGGDVSSTP